MPTSEGDTEQPVGRLMKTNITLVTGCSTGIGRALAEEFHRRGHVVYATARQVSTLSALETRGIRTATLDVTDAENIRRLQARLQHDGVTVALLINNAGYGALGPLAELPMDELRLQFETNVFGLVALVQALLPDMVRQRSGRIVNISSVSGVLPTPFAGAYCATKAAVNALSDSLRMELQPFGIEVITVQPGGVASQFSATAAKRCHLKDASLYAAVAEAIAARVGASQARATPTEVFAHKMADAVLAPNPQAVVRIGHHSLLLPFLKRWLPTRALDRVLSRRFRLDRLS